MKWSRGLGGLCGTFVTMLAAGTVWGNANNDDQAAKAITRAGATLGVSAAVYPPGPCFPPGPCKSTLALDVDPLLRAADLDQNLALRRRSANGASAPVARLLNQTDGTTGLQSVTFAIDDASVLNATVQVPNGYELVSVDTVRYMLRPVAP